MIPTIARAFHKSIELINLTVTMYMIFQGICACIPPITIETLSHCGHFPTNELAPMVWGTLSDRRGRRPIMVACQIILSCSCVGLALVPTSDYWLLMLLRCFQAAGSASTFALGRYLVIEQCRLEELIVGTITTIITRCWARFRYSHSC